jgi:hypothetical protein
MISLPFARMGAGLSARNPSVSDPLSQLWPAAGWSADPGARIQRLLATQRDPTSIVASWYGEQSTRTGLHTENRPVTMSPELMQRGVIEVKNLDAGVGEL